jgi:isopropylmalate/homocitrate/citramalate synthase
MYNANNAKMNELLRKIGTKKKSFFNKLTGTNSKSTEFLYILQRKINMIKDDVKLSNIEKKTNELKKIFLKFKNFSDKIKNKNKEDYYRYHEIYSNTLYYICPYLSAVILNILARSNQNIGELQKLEKTHNELLNLFIWYYDYKNQEYKNMKEVQDEIYQRIKIHPSNPSSSSRASVITHHSSATSNANTSPNQSGYTQSLPNGWAEARTDNGKTLYYHVNTQQITWDRPVLLQNKSSNRSFAAELKTAELKAAANNTNQKLFEIFSQLQTQSRKNNNKKQQIKNMGNTFIANS